MKNLWRDTQGFFYTAVIIVIVLFVADICYLVVALVNATFMDAFADFVAGNLYLEGLQDTLRYVGPTVIVIVNIGLIILLIVSAWKRGSNEREAEELLL